jgi:folate-binding protein YgfZ
LTALGLAGPESRECLERAGIRVPDLAPLELCSPKCDCAWLPAMHAGARRRFREGMSYEIWVAPDKLKSTWDALIARRARPTGTTALNLFRISRGIPQFGVDIRERDLPQETGQTRALNFTKGCYLGQEIVERIRSRGAVHRQFTAFTVEGALPEPGAKIVADEKEVGEITSSAILASARRRSPGGIGLSAPRGAGQRFARGNGEAESGIAAHRLNSRNLKLRKSGKPMAQKRKEESEFKVSDRRLFTSDGELRSRFRGRTSDPRAAAGSGSNGAPTPIAQTATPVSTIPEAASTAASLPNPMFPSLPPPPSSRRSTMLTSSRRAIWIRASNSADTRPKNSK